MIQEFLLILILAKLLPSDLLYSCLGNTHLIHKSAHALIWQFYALSIQVISLLQGINLYRDPPMALE
jgi:hypothetical protein